MYKKIIITSLVIIVVAILIQSGILGALALFLMVGLIPGTSYSLSPSIMLLIMALLAWIVIFRFTALEAFYKYIDKRSVEQHAERKKRMPRRRFSEI